MTQVGIPTLAVMENMCGLRLQGGGEGAAEAARAFASKHALGAEAEAELRSLLAAREAQAAPPQPRTSGLHARLPLPATTATSEPAKEAKGRGGALPGVMRRR